MRPYSCYFLLKDKPSDPKFLLATGSLFQYFMIHEVFPRHQIVAAAMASCIWAALLYLPFELRLDEATLWVGITFLIVTTILTLKKTPLRLGFFLWFLLWVADLLYRYRFLEILTALSEGFTMKAN